MAHVLTEVRWVPECGFWVWHCECGWHDTHGPMEDYKLVEAHREHVREAVLGGDDRMGFLLGANTTPRPIERHPWIAPPSCPSSPTT